MNITVHLNENDYHGERSGTRTRGADTRYSPLAWRRHPPPHNESQPVSQDPVGSTRSLLDETAVLRHGFLDVLGESTSSPVPTVAQRAMNSPFVATVYERLWRPTAFYIASGVTHRAEQHRAASALHLSTAQRLLDVACGPGNFTGPLAEQLPDGGLAVGFDVSAPMLTRAVLDNSGPQTCYVRGDAHKLPFGDETFHAVCCFGALYLMPEPFRVAREMMRVLKPGGRIAILTSYARDAAPIRHALTAGARAIGLTMFDRAAFVDLFSSVGLVDVEQQTQRAMQFVAAAKPG
jgi:ubiquinone/menaquinone biosynthesis C-methylase UbiE